MVKQVYIGSQFFLVMINVPCWQSNPKCCVKGMSKEDSHCPAYSSGKSCYEFDWVSFIKDSSINEKNYWKVHLSKCRFCNIYKVYKNDMDKIISAVKKL